MKIDYLKINNFGKISNKEIKFNDNINIIYGKNEAGKTTILQFIKSMFYGISKNKNGKEVSEFEQYKPWNNSEFSGKIVYQLDSGKIFEIYRDFNKKSPRIYNEKLEEVSNNYNIDKTKGNQFFTEQTKIDEELFLSTTLIEQQEIQLDEQKQNMLLQKITNLISSGDNNISYKKTMDKLNKKLIEQVGTAKTSGRPINLIKEKINKIKNEKMELEEYENKKNNIQDDKKYLINEIEKKENIIILLKEIKKKKEKNKIEQEKIKINNSIISDYNKRLKDLNIEINKKIISKIINPIILIAIFIPIVLLINLLKNDIINIISIFLFSSIFIFYLIYYLKNKNKLIEKNKTIKREIKVIEKNILEKEEEINNDQKKLDKIIEDDKNEIVIKYNKNNLKEINEFLNINYEAINDKIDLLETENSNLKFKLYTLEMEEKDITDKLELKSNCEEQLIVLQDQKRELDVLEESINLAIIKLEEAYKKMKDNLTPKFTKELSLITSNITNGKYRNVVFNDSEGLKVELANGEYIKCSNLSVGTIDQMYLALRISAILETTTENMPILLDEPFAYFDEERLKNILVYLSENFKNNQIIIFTCINREQKLLEENSIKYKIFKLSD